MTDRKFNNSSTSATKHKLTQSCSTSTQTSLLIIKSTLIAFNVFVLTSLSAAWAASDPLTKANSQYSDPQKTSLPVSNMKLNPGRVALIVVDPQVDFLHKNGAAWSVVGKSVIEHNVVQHIEELFIAAKSANLPVFISPHYYYPHDHNWHFEGALEKVMHSIGMFDRPDPLDLTGFNNSGADFLERYKPYINDGETVVTSPHKIYGPEQNDLVLQLRKQRIDQAILAGMSSNLCVESHMRALLEAGFEVAVIKDATAGAIIPEGDGYLAALINFRMIANAVWDTDSTVALIQKLTKSQ